MAIQVGDNFDHKSKKPLDGRISYATLALMKAVADANIYEGCVCYCVENDKYYKFLSTNTVDQTTGKWREYSSGGGGGASAFSDLTDVNISDVQNGQVPKWNSTTEKWENANAGGGSTYTAGDGIVITNDEISTDNATAEDMEEIIPTLPSVMSRRFKYSTDEQVVGEWIDGKPVYQKTVDFGAGPNNTTKSVSTGITNVDTIVSLTSIKNASTFGIFTPDGNGVDSWERVFYNKSDNKIYISNNYDASNYSNSITIQYTKATD